MPGTKATPSIDKATLEIKLAKEPDSNFLTDYIIDHKDYSFIYSL